MMRMALKNFAVRRRVRASIAYPAWESAFAFFLMILLTRTQLVGDISPFPAACFTAGLFAGMPIMPMLLGCIAGARFEILGFAALMPVASVLLSYGLYMGFLSLSPGRVKSSAGKARFASEDAVCLAIAGIATLVSGLIFSKAIRMNALLSLASALISMAIAPVMITALTIRPDRRTLLRDEQMALMLLFLQSLIGLRSVPHIGGMAAPYLAAALTLVAGGQSAGTGAMVGILSGTALTLMGDDPMIAACLAMCGLASGMVRRLGRPASAIAFVLGGIVSMLYDMSYLTGPLHPLGTGLLGAVYSLCPRHIVEKLWTFMSGSNDIPDANRFIRHVRENAESRVRATAMVFDEMYRGYRREGEGPLDEQTMIMELRKKLCADCGKYERCWMGENHESHRMLGGLLADALRGEPLRLDGELPPHMVRNCVRKTEIARKLSKMLLEYHQKRQAAAIRADSRALSARQFQQGAEVLSKLADRFQRTLTVDADATHLMCAVLDREGLRAREVFALSGDSPEITVSLADEMWTREAVLKVESRLTRELGTPLRSTYRAGVYENTIVFTEAPRFKAAVGMATRPKQSGTLSGDHSTATSLPDGMFMLALSDGMGHGDLAAHESETTIRLLKRFLAADVRRELALDAVNSLMNMLGDEIFATVDLCLIDLKSGRAEINKLGACHTTLLRGNGIAHIEGGRLPLGILEKVAPSTSSIALQDGDLLVMITDGVADSAVDEERAFLDALIRKNKALDPQSLSGTILNAVEARDGKPRDDMTVIAVKIAE